MKLEPWSALWNKASKFLSVQNDIQYLKHVTFLHHLVWLFACPIQRVWTTFRFDWQLSEVCPNTTMMPGTMMSWSYTPVFPGARLSLPGTPLKAFFQARLSLPFHKFQIIVWNSAPFPPRTEHPSVSKLERILENYDELVVDCDFPLKTNECFKSSRKRFFIMCFIKDIVCVEQGLLGKRAQIWTSAYI